MRRIPLSPLSVAAVRTLTAGEPLDVEALHRQTGGNPFFVTEALASRGSGIPPTVRDAVLARAARLTPPGRAALEVTAVIGAQVEPSTPRRLGGRRGHGDRGVHGRSGCCRVKAICSPSATSWPGKRSSIRSPRRAAARSTRACCEALASTTAGAPDLARLAHHGEGAADARAVLAHAPAAAAQAAAMGAHREAAAQYARALRFADRAPAADRARLLDAYADEAAIVDWLDEAIRARREAISVHREVGDHLKEGEGLATTASYLVRAGRNAEAEEASRRAIEVLQSLPKGSSLARAYRIQANLRMLNRDRAEAVRWGRRAIALAERVGDRQTLIAAYNTIGAAMLVYGDDRGRVHLERSLALARDAGLHEQVGLAFVNLGSACGEVYRFADADRYLTAGIEYTAERDLEYSQHYMQSWLALTRLYQGRWAEAGDTARPLVERAHVASISRIMALVALGRLRARRGDPGGAACLDEALQLATGTQTLQRLGPVRAARAEAAWLADDRERTAVEARAAWDLAVRHRHSWHTGELAYWRSRAGDRVRLPSWTARPFALQIDGDWRRAATAWDRLGCPYERARALADGDEAARLAAVEAFDRLGARPDMERLRQRLRAEGVRRIPRGPRPSTRQNRFGLTAREVEIVALMAGALTNGRIGARLHISPKTVDHHVSAILAKLGVDSRQEAARLAVQHGLVDHLAVQHGEGVTPK